MKRRARQGEENRGVVFSRRPRARFRAQWLDAPQLAAALGACAGAPAAPAAEPRRLARPVSGAAQQPVCEPPWGGVPEGAQGERAAKASRNRLNRPTARVSSDPAGRSYTVEYLHVPSWVRRGPSW